MRNLNLEKKMDTIHNKMNRHEQINGTILIRDNGLPISSKLPFKKPKNLQISAHIATIFRYISKKNQSDEARIRLENGVNLYMKHIPSKKLILTSLTNNIGNPNLKNLMEKYSMEFYNIFQ